MSLDSLRFSIKLTSGEDGTTDLAVKIPGTFNGVDPTSSSGRFFSSARFWTATTIAEDKVTNLCVKDIDSVLPAPIQALFPAWPILGYSIDQELSFNSTVLNGVFLLGTSPIEIGPNDPNMPRFLPSGLYLCATFVTGDSQPNRILYGNISWTKRS